MEERGKSQIFDIPALGLLYRLIDTVGRYTSFLLFFLLAILLYGVFMRYILGAPSVWVSELSGMLYACYFLVGGSYAILHREHVNVDIFRSRLSERSRAILDLFTWLLFYAMMGVIFWLGIRYAYNSVIRLERSSTVWGAYIWPIKVMLPVSALLMLLAGALKTMSDLIIVFRKPVARRADN